MKPPAAFRASYSDWKLIRTRKVVQIVLEVPVEEADAAYQVLGGMPNPAESFWCAVARLQEGASRSVACDATLREAKMPHKNEPVRRVKQSWDELKPSAQISIRCGEQQFRTFLRETFPHTWTRLDNPDDDITPMEVAIILVREHCGVASRSDISASNPPALDAWQQLECDYRVWQHAPAAGAIA